ncbi:MAG: nucleoside deaminase [Gammaproteobacteria bacterium]
MVDETFMREAIRLATESVQNGGGPFGAVVVRDGRIIGRGANRVTRDNDPTAHAEVQAIRDACRTLGDFRLTGCDLYTSCLPCPMCMGAIYWARIARVFYAATAEDAAAAGFDDRYIADELAKPLQLRDLTITQALRDVGLEPLRLWQEQPNKIEY